MNRHKKITITVAITILLIIGLFFYLFESKESKLPSVINQFVSKLDITGNNNGKNVCTNEQEAVCENDVICLQNYYCIINNSNQNNNQNPTPNPTNTSAATPTPTPTGSSSPTPSPTPSESNEPVGPYMGSENYQIAWDSVNSGGSRSTAGGNTLEDTTGEIATGYSNGTLYNEHAGYQQNDVYTITLGIDPLTTDLGDIGGITGGVLTGSTVATVTTDNPSGYSLYARSSTSPALAKSGDSFANYSESVSGTPDFDWQVSSGDSEFGFSPKGPDVASKFLDNGMNSCNVGSSQTAGKCWFPFLSTDTLIAYRTSKTSTSGSDTTLNLQVESNKIMPAGDYSAEITITAITN